MHDACCRLRAQESASHIDVDDLAKRGQVIIDSWRSSRYAGQGDETANWETSDLFSTLKRLFDTCLACDIALEIFDVPEKFLGRFLKRICDSSVQRALELQDGVALLQISAGGSSAISVHTTSAPCSNSVSVRTEPSPPRPPVTTSGQRVPAGLAAMLPSYG